MAPQYGHANGVNLANYRIISEKRQKEFTGQYRSPFDWQLETAKNVDMCSMENKASSTLRHSSNVLQAAAAELVVSDITSVEQALRTKLRQTEQLKNTLEIAMADVMAEMDLCLQLKASLEQREAKVLEKQSVNEARLKVRCERPGREKTMDDVEGCLLRQQGLVSDFHDKIKRAMSHLDRELSQLESIRRKLAADIVDKAAAIDVDTKVLNIYPDGAPGEAATLRRRADGILKTPHAWATSTEDNVKAARHWILDSTRLRKAVRTAIAGSRSAEHELSRDLNAQMMSKLGATRGLKERLERELERVRNETAQVETQRSSLVNALESKRGPLQQAKERYMARKARPDRERVADDAEAALAREIAHLNAVTSQMSQKLGVVDKELSALDMAALTLEDNIVDKEAALSVDERMVLLDGRINLSTGPPSSIVTSATSSSMSAVREATMRRIQDLEGDLDAARRERETLEANISHLKATFGTSSPKGPFE